jgi:signal transduction histidine kinase
MGKAEIILFIVLANVVLLIFISGILFFVFQYRKRKLLHDKEKATIEKQHKLDLLNNQLQIQQQTMQFIGREIHDSVAQKLTLASIYSQKMEFDNQQSAELEKIKSISTIINDSLLELRDLSKTLTNANIQERDLGELLQQECQRINETGFCRAILEGETRHKLSITVKSFLFRVMQEGIQNGLKHSGCTHINISTADQPEGLSLRLTDDGKGFDSKHSSNDGMGIANMKRRIDLLGGTFQLLSSPGEGTTITIFIPADKLLQDS